MTEQFGGADIRRDRYGRPYVVPPGKRDAEPYTRATTIAGAIDDKEGLMRWKQRMTARGIVARPDLAMALAATSPDDKKALDAIVEQAADAAGATAAATVGTALHAMTERLDLGQPIGPIPAQYEGDVKAYEKLGRDVGWEVLAIEQFVVDHERKIAGTLDRLLRIDGQVYIGDLKSSQTVDYPGKFATQIALYSHMQPYDIATDETREWPDGWQPNQEQGLVIHLPSGQGRASLHVVDIHAGWEAVQLALNVRAWRKRRDLLTDWQTDPLLRLIAAAPDVATLRALWALHRDRWNDEYTLAAKVRQERLSEGVSV